MAGVDEVGRGPLAGAVYAAAVVLDPFVSIEGLDDSKKLSKKRRVKLDLIIKKSALSYCVASADVREIDDLNILQASMLAMERAIAGLKMEVDFVIVDGNRIPDIAFEAEWLIRGDTKIDAIKAASIIAKVARDNEMTRLDKIYPEYGLAKHKGYPTREHREAIRRFGVTPVHRLSFAPCKAVALPK